MQLPDSVASWICTHTRGVDLGTTQARDALPLLAEADLVARGAPNNRNGRLVEQAEAIEQLARYSFSTAFALWGHRMVIEFLSLTNGDFAERFLPGLRAGTVPGASAMAPGYRAMAGGGDLDLRISRDRQDQLRLSGRIAWASNLYPDALAVAPAYGPDAAEKATGPAGGVVVAFALDSPGVTIGPGLDLLAMRGTASTYVELDNVPLGRDQILSTEFIPFLQRTRATLSILQASFCLGLATASYEQAIQTVTGVNEVFRPEIEEQGRRLVETKQRLVELAHRVGTSTPPQPVDILTMRYDAGRLGVELATLEMKTVGGKSFITTSDTNRRYRESTFIPLQSPSEAQLRWEIEQLRE